MFKKPEPNTIYERTASSLLSADMGQSAVLDSDNDGLRNWEETLWNTDPNNPDTDKDGYKDGEETRLGYSPTDFASNVKTGKKDTKNTFLDSDIPQTEGGNLTQNLAEVMAWQIKDPSQLGDKDLSDPFTLLDSNTGSNLLQFIAEFNVEVPESTFKITYDNTYPSVQKYAEAIAQAIPTNPYPNISEDDILADAIQTRNFKKVDEYLNFYDVSIENMQKITIPTDFLEIHKREVELFIATKKVYESVKEINNDPLKTVLALQENQKIREEVVQLLKDFINLVEEHKI
ncbi:hypothetical protein ACFLZC_01355 [Patescibacteria group bacterium]